MFSRSAGILLHPTSFPGPYGIGDLGHTAYQFVDFLVDSKQSLWQVLPLGPTGYGDSPYQCFSAFAGNLLLISPNLLVEDGYLSAAEVESPPDFPTHQVDYGWVIQFKGELLKKAFDHFEANATAEQQTAFDQFQQEQQDWLDDYALFMALKAHHVDVDGGAWNSWPEDIRFREAAAMEQWRSQLAREVRFQAFGQHLFFKQWLRLKEYANGRGVQIIGDMPIFAAYDSADVWANQAVFHLNEDGSPSVVAGVPPDYFSETGQRWGNPLYRWEKMRQNGYEWWIKRLQNAFVLYDIVRIDHFRGFEAYWEIPAEEPTAVKGQWVKGPDKALFEKFEEVLGKLPIIAEDLGVITPEVEELRDTFNFPGMKILQFGFGGTQTSDFLPHNYTQNCVVYTGSHDNNTTLGWYQEAGPEEKDHVRRYLARDDQDVVWDLIRLAHASVATFAIIPMQDLMVLGSEARMNFPGKLGGHWAWRFTAEMMQPWIAPRLRDMTELYGRVYTNQEMSAE